MDKSLELSLSQFPHFPEEVGDFSHLLHRYVRRVKLKDKKMTVRWISFLTKHTKPKKESSNDNGTIAKKNFFSNASLGNSPCDT